MRAGLGPNKHHVRCRFVKSLMTFEGDRWWPCGCTLVGTASAVAGSAAAAAGPAATRLAAALCPTGRKPLTEGSTGLGVTGRCGDPPAFRRCAIAAAPRSHLDSLTCANIFLARLLSGCRRSMNSTRCLFARCAGSITASGMIQRLGPLQIAGTETTTESARPFGTLTVLAQLLRGTTEWGPAAPGGCRCRPTPP